MYVCEIGIFIIYLGVSVFSVNLADEKELLPLAKIKFMRGIKFIQLLHGYIYFNYSNCQDLNRYKYYIINLIITLEQTSSLLQTII